VYFDNQEEYFCSAKTMWKSPFKPFYFMKKQW
jgi:hypothetical protein